MVLRRHVVMSSLCHAATLSPPTLSTITTLKTPLANTDSRTWRICRNTELFRPRTGDWVAGPLLPQGYSFAAGAVLGGEAVVVGGATHGTCAARLREGAWQGLPGCQRPRLHAAVAACAGRLHVLVRRT